jgi:hypothetical protein
MKETFKELYRKLKDYYHSGLITADELEDFLRTYKPTSIEITIGGNPLTEVTSAPGNMEYRVYYEKGRGWIEFNILKEVI